MRWFAALAGLAAGLPAIAVGAGIGVRHVQKTGVTAEALAALLLLVAGLALVGWAVRVLWRRAPGWRRLWFVPGGLVGLALVWTMTLGVMLSVVPATPLGGRTPADQGLQYRDVRFRTTDGAWLSAWLVPARSGAAVVLLHGSGSNREATLPQAAVLARHGFGVLMVDARGHGRSGGQGMDAGWYGERDLAAAVGFLRRVPAVDPQRIAVLGLSMGGEEAIGAAATDRRIRAVVAEGATGRTAADKAGWLPGGPLGTVQRGLDWLTYSAAGVLTAAPRPPALRTAVRRAAGTPFLLITAGARPDERRAALSLRAIAPARVQVWTVPGAEHTQGLGRAPAAWEQHVVEFLTAALRRPA